MAKVFYSEYHFVERCVELNLFAKHRRAKPKYQFIVGELVSIDYDVDIDWNNLSPDDVAQKKRMSTEFTSLMSRIRKNHDKKLRASYGLSKVKAFLTSQRYSVLLPEPPENSNDKYFLRYFHSKFLAFTACFLQCRCRRLSSRKY